MLVTALLIAIFFVFIAKPTQTLPLYPWVELGVIALTEVVALIASYLLTAGGYRGAFVKALVMALLTAGILTYLLKPAAFAGFDIDFVIIFSLEMLGLFFGTILTLRPRNQGAYR